MSESGAKAQLDPEGSEGATGYVSPDDIKDAIGVVYQDMLSYINEDPAGVVDAVTDFQDDLDLKAPLASPTFTGTVTLPSTTSIGSVSNTEIGYLDGVTSALQTQLNGKASSSATLTLGSTTLTLGGTVTTVAGLTLTSPTITNESWTTVADGSMSNSWINYGGGQPSMAYMKEANGYVNMRGLIKSGTTGTTIYTLPSGYRPSVPHSFTVVANAGVARVDVATTGIISVFAYYAGGTNAYVYLNQVRFSVS